MADWLQEEVDLIVADYFSMLAKELTGVPFNKTEHRNQLLQSLPNRERGSIEFKHPNISAVLVKLGLPFIAGYKPRWNYQGLLEERVIDFIEQHKQELEGQFERFVRTDDFQPVHKPNFETVLDKPPAKEQDTLKEPPVTYARRPFKINYLEREQKNASLGASGEEFVIQYERWQLIQAGRETLADKIEWISKDDDGAGFDILSRQIDGSDKYIEVKTTKLSKDTPIFFSVNEYEFAREQSARFHLYRVFNFATQPKMFIVQGSYDSFCEKKPTQFKGMF